MSTIITTTEYDFSSMATMRYAEEREATRRRDLKSLAKVKAAEQAAIEAGRMVSITLKSGAVVQTTAPDRWKDK